MSLSPGIRLGPYEIVSPIGAGGMGEVYKARDTRLDRTVAVKVLPSAFAVDPQLRERFDREARAISALEHPHICALYDVGHESGVDFLVMQYLEGETLAARLEKGALPPEQVLRHASEIADALDAAHRAGIIHRDLKPGNIMITKSGVRLLDFGLAKAGVSVGSGGMSALPTTPANLTAEGTILGTVPYMAPEQLEGREADARTDIFACGAVLFEMASGRRAFEGKSHATLIAAIISSHPPSVSAVQPLLPRGFDFVVSTCLAKDPDDRFQSAHDLKAQLKWLASGTGAVPDGVVRPTRPRRLRLAWAVAAGSAVVAIALAVPATSHLLEKPASVAPARFSVDPPENTVLFDAPEISPDGRRIVFAATDRDSSVHLWVRPIDSLTPTRLAGTDDATYPFWSPESRFVGFFASGKLKKIDLAGGLPQTLADAPTGRGGTWNRDGIILFEASNIGPLMRVSANGGPPVQATKFDVARGETSHRFPSFLPDGRHFLYISLGLKPEDNAIYVGTLDSEERDRLLEGVEGQARYADGFLLFPRKGTLMAQRFDAQRLRLDGTEAAPLAQSVSPGTNTGSASFSVSSAGILAYREGDASRKKYLRWLDRSGKAVGDVGEPAAQQNPAISPDGTRVAVARENDIWIIELARGLSRRLTFDASIETAPVWSADSKAIAYYTEINGPAGNIYRIPSGGGRAEPVVLSKTPTFPYAWSPDGKYVLYGTAGPKGSLEIWSQPLSGDRKPSAYLEATYYQTSATFSPDGRWVAYVSRETGRADVFIESFPTPGAKTQVSISGGDAPRWRRDGRELYYLSLDQKVMAVDVTFGEVVQIGKPTPLFEIPTGAGQRTFVSSEYDVSADGKRFIISIPVQAVGAPITVVMNWLQALKQQ
jgi:eukaryotic-like serine/threonine-protein kinase